MIGIYVFAFIGMDRNAHSMTNPNVAKGDAMIAYDIQFVCVAENKKSTFEIICTFTDMISKIDFFILNHTYVLCG